MKKYNVILRYNGRGSIGQTMGAFVNGRSKEEVQDYVLGNIEIEVEEVKWPVLPVVKKSERFSKECV